MFGADAPRVRALRVARSDRMSHINALGRRRRVVAGLAACAALAAAGAAYAIDTGTSRTVIHACVRIDDPRSLSVRTGAACPAGTKGLSWNQQGPQGIQGIQGVQGMPGIQGVQGSPGLSGFQTVTADVSVPAGVISTFDVGCPSGKTAIGGGGTVPYPAPVLESHPSPAGPSVWRTAAAFPSVAGNFHVAVQCAVVPPASAAARAPA